MRVEQTASGGHTRRAAMRHALEVALTGTQEHLGRLHDAAAGLALVRLPGGRHGA